MTQLRDLEVEEMGLCRLGGHVHVVYPTALRTLCLREKPDNFELVDARATEMVWLPSCDECWSVVTAWAHIRGSGIPRYWRRLIREEVAA